MQQVRFSAEDDLTATPASWTEVRSDAAGVVDLGGNSQTATGEVVYVSTIIAADTAGERTLGLGSTSTCMAWLNGEEVAYLPNVKGLQAEECRVAVPLRAGENVLTLKLECYWERNWMFRATVAP